MTIPATTPETLRQLFDVLLQYQKIAWIDPRPSTAPSARAYDTFSNVLSIYYWKPVTEKGIKAWLTPSDKGDPSVSMWREGLYLPRLEKDSQFVPVLQVECIKNEEWADISLKVMMVCSVEGDETQIGGLGFRMEKGAGRHSFYHAQLIQGFKYGPPVEYPSWLPETQPSFPLTAKCPVTLVLCLLLTLYGTNCLKFFAAHRVFRLEQYIKDLEDWIDWR